MARCSAIKPNGERCKVSVEPGVELCWAHDPTNREHRRRITSKAGKSKKTREIHDLKTQLRGLAEAVLAGEVDRSVGAVAGQLLNIVLRAIELERKIKETEELEERIEALEQDDKGGRSRWGA